VSNFTVKKGDWFVKNFPFEYAYTLVPQNDIALLRLVVQGILGQVTEFIKLFRSPVVSSHSGDSYK
jgi:hypothetical protein